MGRLALQWTHCADHDFKQPSCHGHDGFRGCIAYSFLGDSAGGATKMVRGATKMYFGMKKDVSGTRTT